MGSWRSYHLILLNMTVWERMPKRFVLSELGLYSFSGLCDMYIKLNKGKGYAHFYKFFEPQISLHTAINYTTNLLLNITTSNGLF